MNPRKIIRIIIGIILVFAGISCIITPAATVTPLAWTIGLLIIVHALSCIGVWQERRALGFGENYELISAILSLIFGVVLIVSNFFQTMVSTILSYILASWIAMIGIFRLLVASNLRKLEVDTSVRINNYNTQMIIGVLLILIAVLIFIRPVIVAAVLGIFIGICLAVFGIVQVVLAIRS